MEESIEESKISRKENKAPGLISEVESGRVPLFPKLYIAEMLL
jgi:hypothetical protein